MPPNLVKGDDAEDVAAYVAQRRRQAGRGHRRARAGRRRAGEGTAKAENGKLDDPRRPGRRARLRRSPTPRRQPASWTIDSPNESSVDHNIALEGNGVNEQGQVVKNGGVSKIQVDVDAGEYTFFCSVPGHREGGMEGTLTVK